MNFSELLNRITKLVDLKKISVDGIPGIILALGVLLLFGALGLMPLPTVLQPRTEISIPVVDYLDDGHEVLTGNSMRFGITPASVQLLADSGYCSSFLKAVDDISGKNYDSEKDLLNDLKTYFAVYENEIARLEKAGGSSDLSLEVDYCISGKIGKETSHLQRLRYKVTIEKKAVIRASQKSIIFRDVFTAKASILKLEQEMHRMKAKLDLVRVKISEDSSEQELVKATDKSYDEYLSEVISKNSLRETTIYRKLLGRNQKIGMIRDRIENNRGKEAELSSLINLYNQRLTEINSWVDLDIAVDDLVQNILLIILLGVAIGLVLNPINKAFGGWLGRLLPWIYFAQWQSLTKDKQSLSKDIKSRYKTTAPNSLQKIFNACYSKDSGGYELKNRLEFVVISGARLHKIEEEIKAQSEKAASKKTGSKEFDAENKTEDTAQPLIDQTILNELKLFKDQIFDGIEDVFKKISENLQIQNHVQKQSPSFPDADKPTKVQLEPEDKYAITRALIKLNHPTYYIGKKLMTFEDYKNQIDNYYRYAEVLWNSVIPFLILSAGLIFYVEYLTDSFYCGLIIGMPLMALSCTVFPVLGQLRYLEFRRRSARFIAGRLEIFEEEARKEKEAKDKKAAAEKACCDKLVEALGKIQKDLTKIASKS